MVEFLKEGLEAAEPEDRDRKISSPSILCTSIFQTQVRAIMMKDFARTGVLVWCILMLVFGIWFSLYIARYYSRWYKEKQHEAKEHDLTIEQVNFDPNRLTEAQKLSKQVCPFANLLDEPNHKLSKKFEDRSKQEQCPVSGYVTPLPMLADAVASGPPLPPHPKRNTNKKTR